MTTQTCPRTARSTRSSRPPNGSPPAPVRCAIYTRRSLATGPATERHSLGVQREAAEAYIASRRADGWTMLPGRYQDAGYSGATVERPGLSRLLADVELGAIDRIVVYKVDRLGRSFLDFARLVRFLEGHRASLVSVTERFDTGDTTGRAMLNMLLACAQFEQEVMGERIRDRLGAARRRGRWHSGIPMLGYRLDPATGGLVVVPEEVEPWKLSASIVQRGLPSDPNRRSGGCMDPASHPRSPWADLASNLRS